MALVEWGSATRERLAEVAGSAVAVLPVGAVEQHGPHLPTATDAVVAAEVSRRAAALTAGEADVALLPVLAYGSSDHHLPFGGTLSLAPATLAAVLADLLRSLAHGGFRRVLVVNGHGGNRELCGAAVKQGAVEHGILAAAVSYWDLLGRQPGLDGVPGHAGAFETSAMLALRRDEVRMDRAVPSPGAGSPAPHPAVVLEEPGAWQRIGGFTDDPRRADAALGERAIDEAARALAAVIGAIARRLTSS